ncbi:MAG: hypothetical protein CO113_11120 [Elusimicrobia bacterium CG_4_9_14_3_um_filter_62_55]|nr:MAG: hypothetical protein COR54_15440 [Elusimicrobia bacterium CG22_combo_CG10-13_8_21_14_all_63_91]PJB24957.1 MAG: hypothetical protein CO113_11120 [Elusimicrobia bacterium CG_4_9_14_3_um_filter_62_55]
MLKRLAGSAVCILALTAAESSWAACSYSIKTITDRDAYSADWSGTEELADCSFYFEGSSEWNTQDYTSSETELSFEDGDSHGTKYTFDASGVVSYHNNIPGYLEQDFIQTWTNSVQSLVVRIEKGLTGESGWSRADTKSLTTNSSYETVGTQSYYGGLLTRDYVQTGTNLRKSRDYDFEDSAGSSGKHLTQTDYRYSEAGRGSEFGSSFGYASAYTQSGFSIDEYAGDGLSRTEQSLARSSRSAADNTAYDGGRTVQTRWSVASEQGARSIASGSDSLSASGERTVSANSNRETGAGYDYSSWANSTLITSAWSRSAGGIASWGSDYYSNSRQSVDNTIGSNRTIQDNGDLYASRSGSAGDSSYGNWYRKAWNFVNGILVSVLDQSGSSGDASLAAFYANFDPAVCEQFRDVANAQNADYSYWGLCLDTITPTEIIDPPAEPEPCYGKATGQDKNSKGAENGKGNGLTKNRCDDPSDSGNGKHKA